jgi:hypothetical protein
MDTADSELTSLIELLKPQAVTVITTSPFLMPPQSQSQPSLSASSLWASSSSSSSSSSASSASSLSSTAALRRSLQQSLSSSVSRVASVAASPLSSSSATSKTSSRSVSPPRSPAFAAHSVLAGMNLSLPPSFASASAPISVSSTSSTRLVWPSIPLFRQLLALLARFLERGDQALEFKDVLRRCGLVDVLLRHCQAVADHLLATESADAVAVAVSFRSGDAAAAAAAADEPTLLNEEVYASAVHVLRLLLDKNFENMRHFRQLNGRLSMLLLLRSDVHRCAALSVLQLFTEDDNVADLLMVLRDSKCVAHSLSHARVLSLYLSFCIPHVAIGAHLLVSPTAGTATRFNWTCCTCSAK